ncbi:MAG: hypothetical protein LQ343_003034 [Gyalolechia ehrenbergii]|nr:MAG: hypothetical protein LQ343_003034 [Gyalolechia ehrenbergii]
MDLWKKIERPAPPTTTDYVEDEKPGSSVADVEQNSQSLGIGINSDGQQPHHVHPDIEKRVVRKLDYRISLLFWIARTLGLFEAGFGPGIPYLLSFFYLRYELGFRIGIFLSAAPLATTFAGAFAYGITSGNSQLANWRLLFLVEGLPTIFMAAVAYFFLPVSADKARFLTAEEALVAKARAVRQVGDVERVGGIVLKDILSTLADPKAWFTARVRLANVPLPDNQGSDTRRGTGIAILNMIGQCGPLLGTNIFPKNESPRYFKGMWVSAAFTLFTGFLALGLRTLLVRENKKLDSKYGPKAPRSAGGIDASSQKTAVGEENYGPSFRYIL